MVDSGKPTVLITGVTGYLGSHVTLLFLEEGSYNVRGTVRDTENARKLEPLKKLLGTCITSWTCVQPILQIKRRS